MANSVLPEELMLCILSRLPVKTITRFKSVCKPWFHLFSTPEFKKLHQAQFSMSQKNQFSIFNIEYYKKKPTILDHPFAHAQNIKLDTVGCCNGLFCIRRGQEVVLWNPATKMSKTVPLKDRGPNNMVSLGFGYDAIEDDFKVVMIVANFVYGVGMNITSVEIYSVNLGSWITVDVGFQFCWFLKKSTLIVNGNPYWDARVDGKWVLVCFDVLELVFKIVPIPTIFKPGLNEDASTDVDLVELDGLDEETKTGTRIWTNVEFVDWNGALGAIIIVNHEAEYSVAGSNCCTSTVEYSWVFANLEK
ncbi:hypothetical protein CASFOL_013199 [Castilleja foliolosa]|uniref:F-box domain-containing protein n=1 Tax=Castilleja foliolosa TaxID=1961234 RepID=A0ABD3DN60_9LAMI